jgi:hypothetical protein
MVHTKIMGDTHCPWKELTFFCVPAAPDSIYDPDKHILENIFGKILVLNKKKD